MATQPRRHTNAARLSLEPLEAREVLSATPLAFGAPVVQSDGATESVVRFVSPAGYAPAPYATSTDAAGASVSVVAPFAGFRGALAATQGDVNGDGRLDLVVVAQGAGGHVKVFDGGSGALIQSFRAFDGFDGVMSVGVADVNGDQFGDVLVAASGAGGHVKAVSGRDGALLSSFQAFPGFLGRVAVSGADLDRDGLDDIIVGAGGAGVGGWVGVFSADGTARGGIRAFAGFDGEIGVAGGDVNGDGLGDVVVVAGGHVKTFSGTALAPLGSFRAFAPDLGITNVAVSTGDIDGDNQADILVSGSGTGTRGVWAFDGNAPSPRAYRVETDGPTPTATVSVPPSVQLPGSSAF